MKALSALRDEVAAIDLRIFAALAERQKTVLEIGLLKRDLVLGVVDLAHREVVKTRHQTLGQIYGIDVDVARKLSELLLSYSEALQEVLPGSHPEG